PIRQAKNLVDHEHNRPFCRGLGIGDKSAERSPIVIDRHHFAVAWRLLQEGLGPLLGRQRKSGARREYEESPNASHMRCTLPQASPKIGIKPLVATPIIAISPVLNIHVTHCVSAIYAFPRQPDKSFKRCCVASA